MTCFADSSGFLAIGNPLDNHHKSAAMLWTYLIDNAATITSTNYVVVETISLLHRRYGLSMVKRFRDEILPAITVHWVNEDIHEAAVKVVLAGGREGPSLVDCVSFEVMRRLGISEAFAFDRHFDERGYVQPASAAIGAS